MIQNIYYFKRNQSFSKNLTNIQAKTGKVNLKIITVSYRLDFSVYNVPFAGVDP